MDLVEDERLDGAQRLARAGGEEKEERLGSRDEDVGRLAEHRGALALRRVPGADGYVTTPSGWPALTADPAFVSGESHGIRDFLEGCEAALMGRTTFEPALTNERWPWPNLNVFVLGSRRPPGTPDHVVTDSDPT